MKEEKKELTIIDIETPKSKKISHAEERRKWLERERRQDIREIRNIEYRKKTIIMRKLGVCRRDGCLKETQNNNTLCEEHLKEKRRKEMNKRRNRWKHR